MLVDGKNDVGNRFELNGLDAGCSVGSAYCLFACEASAVRQNFVNKLEKNSIVNFMAAYFTYKC